MQRYPLMYGAQYPNLGQFCYNHPFPRNPGFPEIIGEGEVASVVYPDGSIHLYFIPFEKRFPQAYPNLSYNPYNNNVGAYYVRSVSNPISSGVFNQQCQQMYASRLQRPCYISDCNMNATSPGFELKFHNDCRTSTTDLHYFFPSIRRCEWFPITQPKGCASVQVDIPVKETTFRNQEVICAKPCICAFSDDESWSGTENIKCLCDKVKNSRRSRSVTSKKGSKKSITSKGRTQKQKPKPKKSNVVCECKEPNTTDKSVTTYVDEASNCAADNERNTQTSRSCTTATSIRGVSSRHDIKPEQWFPKASQDREKMPLKSSEKILGVYESTSSSATCCCSTDTEARDV